MDVPLELFFKSSADWAPGAGWHTFLAEFKEGPALSQSAAPAARAPQAVATQAAEPSWKIEMKVKRDAAQKKKAAADEQLKREEAESFLREEQSLARDKTSIEAKKEAAKRAARGHVDQPKRRESLTKKTTEVKFEHHEGYAPAGLSGTTPAHS
jgi:hypothetical protein